jgi:hypothetical protein
MFVMFLLIGVGVTADDSYDAYVIKNITIISPHLNAPLVGHDILIKDGHIAKIGMDLNANKGPTIDGKGKYIIPGLIDGHTHLSDIPGMRYDHRMAYPEIVAQAVAQFPKSYLYHGFTTVIDLNSTPEAIGRWNAANIRPQAYFCGAAPVMDGYPMVFIPKPARYEVARYFVVNQDQQIPKGVDRALHEPEAVVKRVKEDGAICLKMHYETGFGPERNLPIPSFNTAKTLIKTARSLNMPVLFHGNSMEAHEFGTKVGVSAFAHGIWKKGDPKGPLSDTQKAAISKGIAL